MVHIEKRREKEKKEKEGVERMFAIIGQSNKYIKIFEEMVERVNQEAKTFWELDKLEADLQIESLPLKKILKEILKKRLAKLSP